ncbi:PREDICTED: transmembrane protein 198, partial [Apaloderma vittatum]|uniref:transmembrane protein 198 n=1 Tax=Apaloderma vittatum TaxID=57397 RepID=UPI0005219E1B
MPLSGVPRAMTATVQTLRFKLLPPPDCGDLFTGYRCFKAVMFLTGLMFGSIIIFMLCYKERVLDTQLSVEASVGIGLGIGVLCGLVTMLDYFIELFLLVQYIYERIKVAPARPVCWYSWVILGIWPVLTTLGVLVQWKVTAEGYSHTEVIISRQQRRVQLMRIKQREDRKEKKKKRRPHHPPPHQHKAPPPEPAYARSRAPLTFCPPSLAQSYIQSFRERQTGPSLNSLITSSHAVVDLDYDCSSTVPLTTGSGP